jgi:pyruvate/2-oxoglutarate dehydrogenase complex dihydrolipoamide acyltransferase (E2) component
LLGRMPFSHQLKFPRHVGSPVTARLERWGCNPSEFVERGDVIADLSIDSVTHVLCIDFPCLLSSLVVKPGDLLRTGDHLGACAAEAEDIPYRSESLVIRAV